MIMWTHLNNMDDEVFGRWIDGTIEARASNEQGLRDMAVAVIESKDEYDKSLKAIGVDDPKPLQALLDQMGPENRVSMADKVRISDFIIRHLDSRNNPDHNTPKA